MYNITKQTTLVRDEAFCTAIRYDKPLSDEVVELLKKHVIPTETDLDEYVAELWDFKYHTGISEPIHVWVQHLKSDNTYFTFANVFDGIYVPYFNKTLEVNLQFIDLVSQDY